MLFQIATLLSVAHYNMTYRGLCEERETACTYPQTCLPLRHIHTFIHFFSFTTRLPPPPPTHTHTHTRVMSDSSVQWLYSCTSYYATPSQAQNTFSFNPCKSIRSGRNWKKRELTLYMCNSKPRINLKELQVFLINIELSSSLPLLCAH